ncbi:MAG: thioredoxin TrxC [Gammaproteobacteria bacterium]|jgi:thioredoxin 2
MTESLHIVCPACLTVNRVPGARTRQGPKCGHCHERLFTGQPLALTHHSFYKVVKGSDVPICVDFWAPWCGPCRTMAPAFEQAARELEPDVRLAKVDTEAEPGLGSEFGIRSIPTMVLFSKGREVARHSGALGSSDIVRWVRSARGQAAR